MSESIHLATIKPDSLGTSWKASEKLNFRKKQTQDPTSGLPHKCTCTRHGNVVTDICPCLDDDYHMPLLTLEKHESPDDSIKEKRTSITPGWETYVHVREFETEHGSSGTESDYLDDVVPVDRDQKIFCTGSNYVGQWNVLGMKGYGTYIMPHGVEYRGELEDGQFHGNGTLTYPNGLKIRGIFEKGKMIKWDLQFADGLEYNVPWNYCKMPDRRFYPEILDSIKPAGCSYITPEKPPREIPKGCYDTGDGYFDPNMKCIYSAHKPNKILRVASKLEEEWILANCRREEDCTTQYRPDLYTKLVTGCDEYTMEHKKSTETLDSDNIVDDMHEKYIIADLLDIPPIKSELTKTQFGRDVVETSIHDEIHRTAHGSWTKTHAHQQISPVGQSAMVSKLHKFASGTVELDVKQGVQDGTTGPSTVIASSTILKKDSIKTVSLVESYVNNPEDGQKPITTVLGSKAQLSTHGGVRVQTTGIDELDPDDPAYKMQDPDSLPYRYTLEIEEDTLSGKKKLTAPSDKGCIEIEITTNPGEEGQQVTDASLYMKKESEIPMNKQIAEISTGSYISSLGSRANTFIDVVSDKYTSILFIETENKSDELIVDVKSFSHVEPKHKTGVDAMDKPLTYTSQFTHSKDKAPPPETVAISKIDEDNVSIGNSEISRIQNRSIRSISDSVDEYLINQGEEIKFPVGVVNNDDNTDGSQPLTRSTSSTKISSLSDETEGFTDSNSENENIFSAQLLEQIK